ncbi:MAG: PAS domain S-box protein [Verrucomicrobiota bacterium]|nr:PAS domain S-box protein [Verrucomicrobiota bacterium]
MAKRIAAHLRASLDYVEVSRNHYAGLFDFAPISYALLTRHGVIRDINLTGARLLGGARRRLLNMPLTSYCTRPNSTKLIHHLNAVTTAPEPVSIELELGIKKGPRISVRLISRQSQESADLVSTAIVDMTANRESEQERDTFFQVSAELLCVIDFGGRFRKVNPEFLSTFGYTENEVIGQSIEHFLHPDDLARTMAQLGGVTRGEVVHHFENKYRRKDGLFCTLQWTGVPILETEVIYCAARDVTAARQIERSLRQSEETLNRLVIESPMPVFMLADDGAVLHTSRALHRITGLKASEISRLDHLLERISRRAGASVRAAAEQIFSENSAVDGLEFPAQTRAGEERHWSFSASAPGVLRDGRRFSVAMLADITKQTRSREELERHVADRTGALRRANVKLRREIEQRKLLEDEVLEIVDSERRRIGQDLHDGLCQHLTATSFIASALAKKLLQIAPNEARQLRDIAGLVNAGATQARDIARGVHAVGVDAAGLVAALEELASRVNSGITCHFIPSRSPLRVNDLTAQHLYRIAQEAVVNAVKHANPTEITIALTSAPDAGLSISDDGKGIPSHWQKAKGMGFHLMEYRARAIGSSLGVQRLTPRGTRVSCAVVVSTNDDPSPRKKSPSKRSGAQRRHR